MSAKQTEPSTRQATKQRPSVMTRIEFAPRNGRQGVAGAENNVTFSKYRRDHYRRTRGFWVYPLALGILLAPLLSLAKPAVGAVGVWGVAGIVFVLGVVALACYVVARAYDYYIRNQRSPDLPRHSPIAMVAFFCQLLIVPLFLLALAETFSPATGILVAILPQLEREQLRWLSATELVEPDVETPEPHVVTREPADNLSATSTVADDENPFVIEVDAPGDTIDASDLDNPFVIEGE